MHISRKVKCLYRVSGVACLATAALLALTGCAEKPTYDTSTPEGVLIAMQQMVQDGHPEALVTLLEITPRDVTFDDGVTEASAIAEVKQKTGDMLAQLWRIATKLHDRYPNEFAKESTSATEALDRQFPLAAIGKYTQEALRDPFAFVTNQRDKLSAEDMGDGTAALLYEGEPIAGGAVTLVETDDGWKFLVPLDAMRGSEYFPDTREEWAILASLMLGVENAMKDFEDEVDAGEFGSLRAASERVGQMVGGSLIVQSVVYATMKRGDESPSPGGAPESTNE